MALRPETVDATAAEMPTRGFALVTGATEGLGAALAERLARRGMRLLIVARSKGALAETALKLRDAGAAEVAILPLDVTSPHALAEIDAALGRLGAHVAMLVNNTGIGHCGDFSDADPDLLDRLHALNVLAPARLMRHLLPGMRMRKAGSILNIASMGGLVPGPYQAAYYASKAYLISLSEAVAAEVGADGVRISVVAPGPIETAFHARMDSETALYRRTLPTASPASVARWALYGHDLGQRVIVPGVLNAIGALFLRTLPHVVLVPFMALLLKPTRTSEPGARRDA